ncbi:hypothetical protein C667_03023 [Thauera phenylacetica B4P]|uniref:Uncharacterized protein n=1 Tax=Thauera phenylacetica B4P TaxID=1234382 RepID=N6ZW99_9RHOO|nr:hypothetical protein C667_03023 [Thauera phenylacetica B4P]
MDEAGNGESGQAEDGHRERAQTKHDGKLQEVGFPGWLATAGLPEQEDQGAMIQKYELFAFAFYQILLAQPGAPSVAAIMRSGHPPF